MCRMRPRVNRGCRNVPLQRMPVKIMATEHRTTIYVAVLDEGTECWRSVEAILIGDGLFRVSRKSHITKLGRLVLWAFANA